MNKKIFINSGIKIEKGQFNTDFNNQARRTEDGKIFATDVSRKYSIRQNWLLNGYNVLIRKHELPEGKAKSLVNILDSHDIKKKITSKDFFEKIKTFKDIVPFGYVLVTKDINEKAKGAIQINMANDINTQYTVEQILDITSYKPSGDKDENTTIGKKIIVEEGYMNWCMVAEPNTYLSLKETYGVEDKEEVSMKEWTDITNDFIETIKDDVTCLNSAIKSGANNLYNLVVYMKDNNTSINMDLFKKVEVTDEEIDFINSTNAIIESKNKVEKVELYVSENEKYKNIEEQLKNNSIKLEIKSLY